MSGDSFIRAGQAPREEIKQPVWLMSFADFAGCLLASFVLLYSLAQTDRERMQAAFGIEAGPKVEAGTEGGAADKSMKAKPVEDGKNTDYLASLLQTKIDAVPALSDIVVVPLTDKIALDLPVTRLNIDATNADRADDLLFALAGLLAVIPNESAITTELPFSADGENWTKGITLANALAQKLRESGAPDSLAARTAVSSDSVAHVRAVIFRDAEEP